MRAQINSLGIGSVQMVISVTGGMPPVDRVGPLSNKVFQENLEGLNPISSMPFVAEYTPFTLHRSL